jgi:hypothetical protein
MSFPLNDTSSFIINTKNLRNSSKAIVYGTSNFIERIDYFLSGLQIGTVTQTVTYDASDNISESNYYYEGSLYQTETFNYGTSGEILSTDVVLS